MLKWQEDRAVICDSIKKKRSRGKAVLKVKNDMHFLPKWVEHHAKIFGRDGILIFDNMSSDAEMVKYLETLSENFSVFQFNGSHNLLHDVRVYGELYSAIRSSCEYYTFLDADEYLYWCKGDGSLLQGEMLLDAILASGENVIPGIWFENQVGYEDLLYITKKQNRLMSGLRSGKPMISSHFDISGFVNHNIQMPHGTFSNCKTGNLFVAHLKNASVKQRISSNIEKLRSYNANSKDLKSIGISGNDFTLEDILDTNHEKLASGNAKIYIKEIKSLASAQGDGKVDPEPTSAWVRKERIEFNSPDVEREVLDFIASPEADIEKAFT